MIVILHEPEGALNIASVARAMANFGCDDLRVVVNTKESGTELFTEEAKSMACHAQDILASSSVFKSLEDAISDCGAIVGFSARSGSEREYTSSLPDLSTELSKLYQGNWHHNVGLLFGNERYGLPNSALKHCSVICCIPTQPKQPSLNLSHAVAVALYQLSIALPETSPISIPNAPLPSQRSFQQIDDYLANIGVLSGFTRPGGLSNTPLRILSRLFRRAVTSNEEVKALLGLLRRCEMTLEMNSDNDTAP